MRKIKLGFFQDQSLHQLIIDRNITALQQALEQRVDCNVVMDFQDEGNFYEKISPLHLAVRENQPKLVELLLKHGSNRHARDVNNIEPLGYFDARLLDKEEGNLNAMAARVLEVFFRYGESEADFAEAFGQATLDKYKLLVATKTNQCSSLGK